MIRKIVFLFLMVLTTFVQGADIEIVKTGSGKASLGIDGVKGSQKFIGVLKRNIQISGWFTLSDSSTSSLLLYGKQNGNSCAIALKNSANGYIYFSKKFTSSSGEEDLAHQVVDEIVESVKKVPGIATSRIVFIGTVSGKKDLYISDLDGGRMYKVTSDKKSCYAPKWSHDGNNILYTSLHNGFPDVYKIDIGTRKRERIIANPGLNCGAAYSPDGSKIAVVLSKDGNPELYVMDARTKKLKRLTKSANISEASPSWSPDGKKIVYVSDSSGRPNLYIINATGGQPKRISFKGTENVTPCWGSNGKIAYISRVGGRYQVAVYNPLNGDNIIISKDGADYENPSWTPDGRHIVVGRTVNYNSGIYLLDIEGDPAIRLVQQNGDWSSPDCTK
jgi:TolB protein